MNLSQQMQMALNEQLTLERYNAAVYDALAAALDAVNWPGSSKFMKRSADEERTHADKIAGYLVDRNTLPIYDALANPPVHVGDDLVTFFDVALNAEQKTTSAIEELYYLAEGQEDPRTCVFLHWFLAEQTASEREITDILLDLARADAGGRIVLDEKYGEAK